MEIFSEIFGKKEKKPKLGMDKALELFRSKIEQKKKSYRAREKELKKELSTQIEKLKKAINLLSKSETPDELGNGAEQAKNSYCRKIRYLLDRSYPKSLGDLDKSLEQAKPTPRQLAHFTYFFAKPFRSVRKELENCKKLIRKIGKLENPKRKENEIKNLIHLIREKERARKKISSKLRLIKKKLPEVKDKEAKAAKSLRSLDESKVVKLKKEVDELQIKRNKLFCSLASTLSPVKRICRKYAYIKGKSDEFESYIKKPSEKFLHKPGELKEFLTDSLRLAKKGKLKLDAKKLRKLEEILSSIGHLKEGRKLIKEMDGLLEEKKKELAQQSKILASEKESALKKLEQIRAKKRELKARHQNLLMKSTILKKKIGELKTKAEEKFSLVLDREIELK